MTDTSAEAMLACAARIVAGFPAPFAALAAPVLIRVADLPPDDILRDLEIDDPLELTGLYDGIPMTEKHPSDPAPFPDMVWLFRQPILAEWRDRDGVTLEELITNVTVHEIAHHFGWSDDDIAQVDQWWL